MQFWITYNNWISYADKMKACILSLYLVHMCVFLQENSCFPHEGSARTNNVTLNTIKRKLSTNVSKEVQGDATNAETRQEILHNLEQITQNGNMDSYSPDTTAIDGGFTQWTAWSTCSNNCKKRSLRSRERYCTDPPPSNGGASCNGERFQLELCKRAACNQSPLHRQYGSHRSLESLWDSDNDENDVTKWHLGEWSGWSKCNCKTREQKRYRECYSHDNVVCPGDTVETKQCVPTGCQGLDGGGDKSSLVNINPVEFCGFSPCDISKCLVAPLGSCVSDYKCRPVFFDEKNKQVQECSGKRIYLNPSKISEVCKINPCQYTRCLLDFSQERCVVGTKCQAVYYNNQGQPQTCTAILKVPAHDVCGYDPCVGGETCEDNPTARCLVTTKCRPIYVNDFNERIRKCEKTGEDRSDVKAASKEDEFEAEPDDDDDDVTDDDDTDDGDTTEDYDDVTDDDNDIDDSFEGGDSRSELYHGTHSARSRGKNWRDDDVYDDDDDDDDDREDDVNYHDDGDGNFNEMLASRRQKTKQPRVKALSNKNTTKVPLLFHLLNTEESDRRSNRIPKPERHTHSTTTLPLSDILLGKLNNTRHVLTGSVRHPLKIISNKKPTKYYYFETEDGKTNKTRQFMVITASKSKKSRLANKRFVIQD